jgi:hypothetical protein
VVHEPDGPDAGSRRIRREQLERAQRIRTPQVDDDELRPRAAATSASASAAASTDTPSSSAAARIFATKKRSPTR